MELQLKHVSVSLIGAIGLILLLASIFLNSLPFKIALFVAISLWILSGVLATFFGIPKNIHGQRNSVQQNSGWKSSVILSPLKSGIVSLISSLGIIALLSGILLGVPFIDALFVALVLWICVGIIIFYLSSNKKTIYYN